MDLLDINTVCQMLGTTSRTLRFYEQKGIVTSTTVPFCSRRHYSAEQVEHIKKVLVLRALGLSVAQIRKLQDGNVKLSDAILEHKAELIASIVAKAKELRMLDDALATIEKGGSVYDPTDQTPMTQSMRLEIARSFTDLFIQGEYDTCFAYFSDMLQEYMPLSAWKRVVCDTVKPLGVLLHVKEIESDSEVKNVVNCRLQYEKMGLCVKIVFHRDKVHGIWLNYEL